MGSYNTAVLTTAGQSLLTSILGAEGTLTFSKFQTSSYQYASGTDLSALTSLQSVEQEVIPSAGGVKDATTFYSSSTVSNEGVTVEYDCYTVGLFATDGEDEVLFAVATAITPDVIPVDDGSTPSTYTYTMSIGVSSTENITVEVDDQGILRVTSIVDNLTSTSTTQPLSANQGKVLKGIADDNTGAIEAIVNVYGSKNLNSYPYIETTKTANGITFTDNGDGTVTLGIGTASADTEYLMHRRIDSPSLGLKLKNGEYKLNGCPSGYNQKLKITAAYSGKISGDYTSLGADEGEGLSFEINGSYQSNDYAILTLSIWVASGTTITVPITFEPMIYDARITDPTFAPWAMTNRQLTESVTELNSNKPNYFPQTPTVYQTLWSCEETSAYDYTIPKTGWYDLAITNEAPSHITSGSRSAIQIKRSNNSFWTLVYDYVADSDNNGSQLLNITLPLKAGTVIRYTNDTASNPKFYCKCVRFE